MTTSAVPTNAVACSVFSPVYWSKSDTDKTIAQIKEYNAAGKSLCGWGKPVAKPVTFSGISFKDRWYKFKTRLAWTP